MTDLAALRPGQDVDLQSEAVLGVLEFHSIPDIRIKQDELLDLWIKHGLAQEFVPRIRPVDAFRRATTAVQRTIYIEQNGVTYEAHIEVDDVTKDNSTVVRLLNRKLIDKVNQQTPLLTVGKFEFDRATATMRISVNPAAAGEYDYRSILFEARDLYLEFRDYHTRDTLRNIVTKLVRSTRPLSIVERSQGKFIPREHIPTMQKLQNLLRELQERVPDQDCSLDLIPLVNAPDLRRLLAKRLKVEVLEESQALLDEAKEIRQKYGKIKLEKAQSLLEQFIGLREKIEVYEKLINTTLPELRDHIKWAMDNIDIDDDDNGLIGIDLETETTEVCMC